MNVEFGVDAVAASVCKNFEELLSGVVVALYLPPTLDSTRTRLIAPYRANAHDHTPWRNLYGPDVPVRVTTDSLVEVDERIKIKTYRQIISEYALHPEAKFLDFSDVPCHRGSRGLLHRDHIYAARWAIIGKEANQLDEVENGLATPTEVTTVYDDGAREHLRQQILPSLRHLSGRELASLVGCDHRTVNRIRHGQMPRRELYQRLVTLTQEISTRTP